MRPVSTEVRIQSASTACQIKKIEDQYDQLKSSYESKLTELDREKLDLGKELDEAATKNSQLMSIVKQK